MGKFLRPGNWLTVVDRYGDDTGDMWQCSPDDRGLKPEDILRMDGLPGDAYSGLALCRYEYEGPHAMRMHSAVCAVACTAAGMERLLRSAAYRFSVLGVLTREEAGAAVGELGAADFDTAGNFT